MTEKQKIVFKWLAILVLVAAVIDDYLFFTGLNGTTLTRAILSGIVNCIFTCTAIFFVIWTIRKNRS
jgi:uncharacterized membrane protein YtjA (UPF0391 family)